MSIYNFIFVMATPHCKNIIKLKSHILCKTQLNVWMQKKKRKKEHENENVIDSINEIVYHSYNRTRGI